MTTTAVAPKPLPLPGGATLGQLAGTPIVRVNYEGTQLAVWAEGGFLRKTNFTAERPITTSQDSFVMPHLTPSYRQRFMNGSVKGADDQVRRFVAAGDSFDGALQLAGKMNGQSYNGLQEMAVVQAEQGKYFIAPLGFFKGRSFHYNTTSLDMPQGDITSSGPWKVTPEGTPKSIPGKGARITQHNGKVASLEALHSAVQAIVNKDGWFDLRDGKAAAAPSSPAEAPAA